MLVGEWVKLPTTEEEMQKVFERIGIGKQDDFGQPYEEWFITDYECPIYGVQKMLGEYESLDKLNYLAALIDELSLSDQEKLVAIMEAGCDEVSDIDDLINLTFNLDCYDIMPGINDESDLGYYYAHEAGIYSEKDLGPLANYIDYERYGRDIAMDEQGRFTDEGYVRVASERWDRQFNGELDDIPDEYRITGSGEATERDSTIAVLIVEPGKEPYVKEIDSGLESLQHEVGGYIEAIYPYEDPVALVCNEEGKLEGLPLNRALRDEDGDIYDVVAGTFLVANTTCLCSLYRHPPSLSAGSGRFTLLRSRTSSAAEGYCPGCPGHLAEKQVQRQTTYCRSDRSSFHLMIYWMCQSCRQQFFLA